MGLKFQRLPNFCYWCDRVTHGERECDVWLRGKGNLRKEDQQFGEWLRADSVRMAKNFITVIFGAFRTQALWWKKPGSKVHSPTSQSEVAPVRGLGNDNTVEAASFVTMVRDIEGLKINKKDNPIVRTPTRETCAKQSLCEVNMAPHANSPSPMPLGDCFNMASSLIPAQQTRK